MGLDNVGNINNFWFYSCGIYHLLKEKSKYAGKYLFELGEEERKGIIGMCMSYTTGNIVSKLVGDSTKNITAGLEKVLAEAEKAEEKK